MTNHGISAAIQAWETLSPFWQSRIEQAVAPEVQVSGLVCPNSLSDLIELVSSTDQSILPCGAASKLDWGGLLQLGKKAKQSSSKLLVVSTERTNQLIDHAVGDLTVTVETGMRFADLQAILAKEGQFLAIDPAYPDQATIGGIIATADTGSLRQRYNSVRDMLLGISFVRADGQVAKAGGRVVKNVAGYDLMKLFTGSYGTLGIVTQATFRVYPLPEASRTILLTGEAAALSQATTTLLSSALTPVHADLLAPAVVETLGLGQGMGLAICFQSIRPSVNEQTTRMAEVAEKLGLAYTTFSDTEESSLWQQLRERMTASNHRDKILCKIGVRSSAAVSVLKQIEALPISDCLVQIHAGSGLGRLVLNAAVSPETLLNLRSLFQVNGGFLSILQAAIALKQQVDVWGYTGNAFEIMRQIKKQFDPMSRLSSHRFVGER